MTDVLLATDSDELFASIDAALASDDTSVYRVRNGHDVVPVVEQKDPDLVILDLQMQLQEIRDCVGNAVPGGLPQCGLAAFQ